MKTKSIACFTLVGAIASSEPEELSPLISDRMAKGDSSMSQRPKWAAETQIVATDTRTSSVELRDKVELTPVSLI